MSVKFTKDIFIYESIKIHGDKYDYSLVDYTKSSEKVVIICREHGNFIQRASNHLQGRGCYDCKKTRKYDSEKFIDLSNKVHNGKYLYDKVIYNGSHSDVIITCLEHSDFKQSPTNHLRGKGCGRCATESTRLVLYDFINRCNLVHNSKYDYDLIIYQNLRTDVLIKCKEHGDFIQRAKNHLDGQGCPKCGDNFGIKENKWLDSLNISERQFRIGRYVVDGYDPDTKTIYEFNGDFWHGNPDIFKKNDYNNVLKRTFGELYEKTLKKEIELKKMGYRVISIWENDFNKL
jgi:very-short-patch-repair endonuclease